MKTHCELCFRHCAIEEGKTGFCRARANVGGKIEPIAYGKVVSLALDPIEKKPLRRFRSGSVVLSLGSFGCNMTCPFCQNHEISQASDGELPYRQMAPEDIAALALNLVPKGNIGVAYTYNEPLTNYEYIMDCSKAVHRCGLQNVLVSNAMIEEKPWKELLPLIDAANIDLKGFTDDWYRQLGGSLEVAKRNISTAASLCHIEVTTLIVPGKNDGEAEMRALSSWLSSISPDIPLHISRYFPRWRMINVPPTPVDTVYRLTEVAHENLKWVYSGNC